MIVVNLVSGLGNQLFQYAFAKTIALRNNVDLKLDNSFFDHQNLRKFELNNFQLESSIVDYEDLVFFKKIKSSLNLKYKILRKLERFLPEYRRSIFIEKKLWEYDDTAKKINDNTYLEGYWQNANYYINLDSSIRDEFLIKNPYDPRYLTYLNNIEKSNSISIHIRRKDYITDVNASSTLGALSIEYYNKAIRYISSKVLDPIFYVFSDDLEWAKKNLLTKATYVEIEDGKLPHFELSLMSKCKHNIIANSSFSWWGAFLNRNEEKIVIMPKNWVRDDSINKKINLKLSSWIQL